MAGFRNLYISVHIQSYSQKNFKLPKPLYTPNPYRYIQTQNKKGKKMKRETIAYIKGISEHCRKFSNEGTYGYLENVLFQLKRKEQVQKDKLVTITEEITGVEELIEIVLAKIDHEAEEQSAELGVNEKCK